MAKTINSDLIRGNINTIILKALFEGDRYGYDIIKEIEEKSHGQYILKQPTLYSCLKRLENQGFIEAYWGEQSTNGGRRKYYRLTDAGREVFKQNQDEYEYSRTVIDTLISDSKYDLSSLPHQTAEADTDEQSEENTSKENTPTNTELEVISQNNQNNSENEIPVEEDNRLEENTNSNENTNNSVLIDETSVFSKVEELPEEIKEEKTVPLEPIIEKPADYLAPPPSFDFSQQQEKTEETNETKTEVPNVDTTSIIDDMLKSNSKSYFDRDKQESVATTIDTTSVNDSQDEDEIAKKLNELQSTYESLYKQSEEKSSELEIKEKNDEQTASPITNLNEENYSNGFFKYNKINPEHDKKVSAEERQLGKTILNQAKKNAVVTQNASTEQKNISIKDQIKIRNYGRLKQSIEDLGESAKVRTHTDTSRDFQKQYYYKDNYLRLFSNGIMFIILLCEIFALYVVGKLVIGANTQYDQFIYIFSIVLCFLLPLFAVARFIHKPDSTKRNEFNLKSSLIFKIIIAIQIILITYAINIYLEMPITFSSNYFITLTIPTIFALNLPFSSIIFDSLRKKEKFSAKD